MTEKTCLILLSGGQDSATCMAWALAHYSAIHAVTFDYGQRHRAEIAAAKTVADMCGAYHRTIKVSSLAEIGGSTLIAGGDSGDWSDDLGDIPDTFVPGRNLIFLSIAAALAAKLGVSDIITGVCQTDFSGYPDCRERFIRAAESAINMAMPDGAGPFKIITPLMNLTKADSVHMIKRLGGGHLLRHTVTCYRGDRPGCGSCASCVLRSRGFAAAGLSDPAGVS